MGTPQMRHTIYPFIAALVLSANFATAAEPLNVGVAQVDITPPVGYRMSGYFYERLNTGTHDPLYAIIILPAKY